MARKPEGGAGGSPGGKKRKGESGDEIADFLASLESIEAAGRPIDYSEIGDSGRLRTQVAHLGDVEKRLRQVLEQEIQDRGRATVINGLNSAMANIGSNVRAMEARLKDLQTLPVEASVSEAGQAKPPKKTRRSKPARPTEPAEPTETAKPSELIEPSEPPAPAAKIIRPFFGLPDRPLPKIERPVAAKPSVAAKPAQVEPEPPKAEPHVVDGLELLPYFDTPQEEREGARVSAPTPGASDSSDFFEGLAPLTETAAPPQPAETAPEPPKWHEILTDADRAELEGSAVTSAPARRQSMFEPPEIARAEVEPQPVETPEEPEAASTTAAQEERGLPVLEMPSFPEAQAELSEKPNWQKVLENEDIFLPLSFAGLPSARIEGFLAKPLKVIKGVLSRKYAEQKKERIAALRAVNEYVETVVNPALSAAREFESRLNPLAQEVHRLQEELRLVGAVKPKLKALDEKIKILFRNLLNLEKVQRKNPDAFGEFVQVTLANISETLRAAAEAGITQIAGTPGIEALGSIEGTDEQKTQGLLQNKMGFLDMVKGLREEVNQALEKIGSMRQRLDIQAEELGLLREQRRLRGERSEAKGGYGKRGAPASKSFEFAMMGYYCRIPARLASLSKEDHPLYEQLIKANTEELISLQQTENEQTRVAAKLMIEYRLRQLAELFKQVKQQAEAAETAKQTQELSDCLITLRIAKARFDNLKAALAAGPSRMFGPDARTHAAGMVVRSQSGGGRETLPAWEEVQELRQHPPAPEAGVDEEELARLGGQKFYEVVAPKLAGTQILYKIFGQRGQPDEIVFSAGQALGMPQFVKYRLEIPGRIFTGYVNESGTIIHSSEQAALLAGKIYARDQIPDQDYVDEALVLFNPEKPANFEETKERLQRIFSALKPLAGSEIFYDAGAGRASLEIWGGTGDYENILRVRISGGSGPAGLDSNFIISVSGVAEAGSNFRSIDLNNSALVADRLEHDVIALLPEFTYICRTELLETGKLLAEVADKLKEEPVPAPPPARAPAAPPQERVPGPTAAASAPEAPVVPPAAPPAPAAETFKAREAQKPSLGKLIFDTFRPLVTPQRPKIEDFEFESEGTKFEGSLELVQHPEKGDVMIFTFERGGKKIKLVADREGNDVAL